MRVRVADIVDVLDLQFDEQLSYLNIDTGEVETVSREVLSMVEEGEPADDLPEWQHREFEVATSIVESDRFLRLPSKEDVHEWQIMDDFAHAVEDHSIRNHLLSAIRGRGAFRYFKDVIHHHGIQEDWYVFRKDALREIAIDWLEEKGLEYSET
jgi:hypothetical protein